MTVYYCTKKNVTSQIQPFGYEIDGNNFSKNIFKNIYLLLLKI